MSTTDNSPTPELTEGGAEPQPGTVEHLRLLHQLVARELLRSMRRKGAARGRPSLGMLNAARLFLQDNGIGGRYPGTPVAQEQLAQLYAAYNRRLLDLAASGAVNATLVAEVRHWLTANNAFRPVGGGDALSPTGGIEGADLLALPFATKDKE